MTWNPDGTYLAVAVTDTTSGRVILLNPQTGVVKTMFDEPAGTLGISLEKDSDA
ncbi:MAG TPA: hypothetical protein VH593_03185 [Ktedonobacteraceae bacterium]|jgi:hypothetical protein